MEFLPVSPEALNKAADVLRSGGIVAFPTETVYGLGADAYNPSALVKIFEAKGRPRFDPLIIHIAAVQTLEEVADFSLLSEETRRKLFLLSEQLWPGPLSIVLPKNARIPGIATAALSTAAIRFPAHEAARTLISLSGGAVAAPSANPFGALSPTRAEHVRDALGKKVDIILDGGPAQIGVESTVLDITGNCIRILRHGGAPKEAVENIIGAVQDASLANEDTAGGFVSPGQLKSHYAPRTPLSVFKREEIIRLPCETSAAYIFFDDSSCHTWLMEKGGQTRKEKIKVLSPSGLLSEAAACLFDTLHELDNRQFSHIFAQLVPQEGIGAAINDRLERAGNL
ncbi:MAG: threonylcarbamoyl-AMP synthase [Treponema sp.]|jgi:L-threonylcarbamoyladenylate synthase|nr:threonylcarbamoyl-AMP synthase [Treponema sp.]